MMTLLYIPSIFGVSLEVYFILIILGVPIFLISRWLLKKLIKVEKTRKIATWIVTLIATPLVYIGLIMLWLFAIAYHPNHDFDKQKWSADKEKRYELSDDIINSKMLIGKTKAEVRQILGEEGNADQSDFWNYYIGFEPSFANIDPDYLVIEFKQGKVIKVRQRET
jgi:hypothetical protein